MQIHSVQLIARDNLPLAETRVRRSWSGLSVESVRLGDARGFDYDWQGDMHYLAVHDILLRDGEVAVGSDVRANRADLRDCMSFVPQHARVSGWSELAGEGSGYAAVFFDPELAEAEYERPLVGAAARPLLYFEDARLCRTLWRIDQMVRSDDDIDPLAAETLGLLAVLQLYPLLGGSYRTGAGQLAPRQQCQLDDFISSNIGAAITLSDLAAVVGLSRYHFARTFTRTYGRAPHQHLLLRRIGIAASLLTTTRLPVGEIAKWVGFSSAARLSTAFRRLVGSSPSAFRVAAK